MKKMGLVFHAGFCFGFRVCNDGSRILHFSLDGSFYNWDSTEYIIIEYKNGVPHSR